LPRQALFLHHIQKKHFMIIGKGENEFMKKKISVFSLALGILLATTPTAFAGANQYDVAYTKDTVQGVIASDFSVNAADSYNYDGTFSHLIYSSTSTIVTWGDTLIVKGKQQSTNSSYPDLYIQYTFVNKGTKASDPDDDILLTGTTTVNSGSYTVPGEYNLSFYINSQAKNTTAHLRAWNLNNSDGSSSKKTVHIWGSVSKQ